MNFKLTISYDGSRYKGWQRLGENTIQYKIEAVLSKLFDKKIEITGASRTDAGVHAINQVANFKTSADLEPKEIQDYLTKYLPDDICVTNVECVDDTFHARYNAVSKTYLYKIWNCGQPNPFYRKYSMHIEKPLDIEAMKNAARYLIGSHDFTAFTNAKSKKKSMQREIYSVDIWECGGFAHIRVSGNGFLHNMVRRITGVLIEVGRNNIDPSKIPEILDSKDRSKVTLIAEAKGLFLEKIEYEK